MWLRPRHCSGNYISYDIQQSPYSNLSFIFLIFWLVVAACATIFGSERLCLPPSTRLFSSSFLFPLIRLDEWLCDDAAAQQCRQWTCQTIYFLFVFSFLLRPFFSLFVFLLLVSLSWWLCRARGLFPEMVCHCVRSLLIHRFPGTSCSWIRPRRKDLLLLDIRRQKRKPTRTVASSGLQFRVLISSLLLLLLLLVSSPGLLLLFSFSQSSVGRSRWVLPSVRPSVELLTAQQWGTGAHK